MSHVVLDSPLDRRRAGTISRQPLDFYERFQHKAGVEVIDEASFPIHGVVPRAIDVLRFEYKMHITFSLSSVLIFRKIQRSLRQQECPIRARIDDPADWFRKWGI